MLAQNHPAVYYWRVFDLDYMYIMSTTLFGINDGEGENNRVTLFAKQ